MGARSRTRVCREKIQNTNGRSCGVNGGDETMTDKEWPLYEVFIRAKSGLSHRHAGSVHAPDDQMALDHARDTYTRRMEGVSIWVVPSDRIVASDPAETSAFFEPAEDKVYRHPTFYKIPEGVENL